MTGERKDKDLRVSSRRTTDARVGRSSQRAFRPLRWAWLLLMAALLAPTLDLFFPAGFQPPKQRRTIVIERGTTLHEIARDLQRSGVIKSQVGFLVLARTMQLDRSVKAGQYSFRLGITVPALLRALDRGMYGLNLVTIPEGLMIRETARIIELQVGISAFALDSLSRDPAMLDSLEIGAPSLEGWLAPDSYEWLPGTAPEVVLRTMVSRTRERVQRATAGYDSLPLGMNQHEVLTLASIVEAESRANDERPRIARVYLNRLERGMLLQADPTVGYALGRGPRSRLLFKDLRVESAYNTYRHEGLPPGPICSPGESAIQAVMNATPSTNELYFVANGKGRHIFAPTYQQHLENIQMVKARMRAEALANAKTAAQAPSRAASVPAPSLTAADDDEVVSGEVGDSASVKPTGKAPPPPGTPHAPAPSAPVPGVISQGTSAKSQSPPLANLTRLAPATAGSTSTAGAATKTDPKLDAKSDPKPDPKSAASASKPTAAVPTPSEPLKGQLLTPRRGATVASTSPGSVEVVKKTPVDAGAKKATATAPTKSGTTTQPSTSSKTTTTSKSTTTASKPAATDSKSGSATKASSTAKPATKADTTAAKKKSSGSGTTKASTTTTKSSTGSTSEKAPAKKPAAKPAAKDSTR